MPDCPFCYPDQVLWESEHYRILPDAFPRCAGHVLLVTRAHLASHMHAPAEWLPELRAAQERVRMFLRNRFGAAAFFENGGSRQQVPHAHLHGFPFRPQVRRKWLREGKVARIDGWEDARREKEAAGHYFYLETDEGCYLVRRYGFVMKRIKGQLVAQTEAAFDPETGRLARGGPEMVRRTRELWNA